jgi:hypothetical protein
MEKGKKGMKYFDFETFETEQADIWQRIQSLSDSISEKEKNQNDQLKQYEVYIEDRIEDSAKLLNGDIRVNTNYDITSIYERFQEALLKKKPTKTYDQKLDEVIFNMREIESLFYSLSLSIEDIKARESFDIIFNNWKNDQLAKRY